MWGQFPLSFCGQRQAFVGKKHTHKSDWYWAIQYLTLGVTSWPILRSLDWKKKVPEYIAYIDRYHFTKFGWPDFSLCSGQCLFIDTYYLRWGMPPSTLKFSWIWMMNCKITLHQVGSDPRGLSYRVMAS